MPVLGRWPANVVHDGSPEVLAQFPHTRSGTFNGVRSADKFRHAFGEFKGTPEGEGSYTANEGSAARFFYCAKASKRDRDEGCEAFEEVLKRNALTTHTHNGQGDFRGVDKKPLAKARNPHPTVKPTELMRWLVRLVAPVGGLVCDPFLGSGSTGKACALEGMRFCGIDLDPAFVAIAEARIRHALQMSHSTKEAAPC